MVCNCKRKGEGEVYTRVDGLGELLSKGKVAVVRVDFNVPIKNGEILDDTRIRASLETINFLLQKGVSVVLVSHLGRPKKVDRDKTLRPVADRLAQLLGKEVLFSDLEEAREKVANFYPASVLLLENIRFYPGETKGDITHLLFSKESVGKILRKKG